MNMMGLDTGLQYCLPEMGLVRPVAVGSVAQSIGRIHKKTVAADIVAGLVAGLATGLEVVGHGSLAVGYNTAEQNAAVVARRFPADSMTGSEIATGPAIAAVAEFPMTEEAIAGLGFLRMVGNMNVQREVESAVECLTIVVAAAVLDFQFVTGSTTARTSSVPAVAAIVAAAGCPKVEEVEEAAVVLDFQAVGSKIVPQTGVVAATAVAASVALDPTVPD